VLPSSSRRWRVRSTSSCTSAPIRRARGGSARSLAVTGRAEAEIIETSEIFAHVDGVLRRADGYPPHEDRYRNAGFELADLLGSGYRGRRVALTQVP
jgi:hypothetical protein